MSKKRARVLGMGKEIFKDDEFEQIHPVDGFVSDESHIINLKIDEIKPNPEQPRKFFSEKGIIELSNSIQQHGLLQPIIVKKNEKGFLVVAGERRYRAAKMAGFKKISALIKSDNPLEISIIENIQREDLKPLEEAEGLQLLVDRFEYTHEALAKVIGKSRSSITEILSLNKLPNQIKEKCRTSDIHSKSLLLQITREQTEENMISLWEKIKDGNVPVKKIKKGSIRRSRPKPFEYKFVSPEKDFSLKIQFKKGEVDKEKIKLAFEKAFNNFLERYSNDYFL